MARSAFSETNSFASIIIEIGVTFSTSFHFSAMKECLSVSFYCKFPCKWHVCIPFLTELSCSVICKPHLITDSQKCSSPCGRMPSLVLGFELAYHFQNPLVYQTHRGSRVRFRPPWGSCLLRTHLHGFGAIHSMKSSEDQGRIKRRKIAVACDDCRTRKVRCDGVQPGTWRSPRVRNATRAEVTQYVGHVARG